MIDRCVAPRLAVGQRLVGCRSPESIGEMRVVASPCLNRGDGEAMGVEMVRDCGCLPVVAGDDDQVGACMERVFGDLAGDRVSVALVHRFGAALIPGLVTAGVSMGLDMVALHRADLGEIDVIQFEQIGAQVIDDRNDGGERSTSSSSAASMAGHGPTCARCPTV